MAVQRATVDGIEFRLIDSLYFEALGADGAWSPSGDSATKVAGLARLLGFVHPLDVVSPTTIDAPTPDAADEKPDLSESELADHLETCAAAINVALGDAPRIHRNVLLRPHVVMRWRDTLMQLAEALR